MTSVLTYLMLSKLTSVVQTYLSNLADNFYINPDIFLYYSTYLHVCNTCIFISIHLMLRSQIKLTSYDFSDLHITGEFDF